ncbi:MAG: TetR/AcrR family transcriptional regulator [Lachnospiraceae bacterium]|nr:TetR/AcrR family transcriptional regulator [Lachnospiraceae bacterium]
MLKKVPYNEISVTALCDKAGVTRMSFYRNFNTKEDVLEAWISSITEDFLRDSRIS